MTTLMKICTGIGRKLFRPTTTTRSPPVSYSTRSINTLILLRHGQSVWNGPNSKFTGWADVPLTVRGRVEAVAAGQLLRNKGIKAKNVDVAFTSELERAHETCELVLASMAGPDQNSWNSDRIRRDWRLNERHYGAVQGMCKNDPTLLNNFSPKVLQAWRRSMTAKPPPLDTTHEYWLPPPAPLTESLEDCQRRAMDCFESTISPALFQEDGLPTPPDKRTVLVVAHSNTIRSLMAGFDDVPEELVPKLHVPNSVPILYRFNSSTRKPVSIKLESAAGGSHARWMLSAENHRAVREAIQPGGMLTRALFDALDNDGDLKLTSADMEAGMRELLQHEEDHHEHIDCVVMALVKKIAKEMSPDEVISYPDFERRASMASEELQNTSNLEEYEPFNEEPFP